MRLTAYVVNTMNQGTANNKWAKLIWTFHPYTFDWWRRRKARIASLVQRLGSMFDDLRFASPQWRGFSLLRKVQTGSGAQPASYSTGTDDLSGGEAAGAWILTADLHLVSRLRVNGTVRSLPLHITSPMALGSIFMPCVATVASG